MTDAMWHHFGLVEAPTRERSLFSSWPIIMDVENGTSSSMEVADIMRTMSSSPSVQSSDQHRVQNNVNNIANDYDTEPLLDEEVVQFRSRVMGMDVLNDNGASSRERELAKMVIYTLLIPLLYSNIITGPAAHRAFPAYFSSDRQPGCYYLGTLASARLFGASGRGAARSVGLGKSWLGKGVRGLDCSKEK